MDSPYSRGPVAGIFASASFRRLWALGGVVNAMRWVEMLAAGLFTFKVTGSGVAVALVLAARSLPMLCFGALAGLLCDAVSRKRILFWGMVLCAAAAAGICLLDAMGVVRPWHIALAAFVSGSVWATELSARRRMIGECAGPDLVSRVVALDSLTNSLARIVGPLLGSFTFAAFGLSGAFGISAACYLGAALLVPGIRHHQQTRPLMLSRLPRELAEGFGYARRQPTVLAVLGVTATMNLFAFSYSAVLAPIARVGFGVSDALVGVLAAGEPLGALLGGLLLAGRGPPGSPMALMIGGSAVFMSALAAMPLTPDYALACLVLVAGGLGLAMFGNMQTSLVLTRVPASIRSRQMGLITVCIGVAPVGQLIIGLLSEGFGPLRAVVISGLAGLLSLGGVAWLSGGRAKEADRR